MKKKFLYSILVLGAILSCVPDDRNNNMVDDSFGVAAKTLVQDVSIHAGSYTVGLVKNGKGQQSGTLRIVTDQTKVQAALDQFNKDNRTAYKGIMPASIYWENTTFSFRPEDIVKNLRLSWDPELVGYLMGDESNYVIPILLEGEGVQVNEGRSFMVIRLTRSSLSVVQASQARTVARKNVEPGPDGQTPELQEIITLDLNLSQAIKGVGMSFPVVADPSLIDTFNATQEMDYTPAPEGLVTILDKQVNIAEGSLGNTYRIQIDKSKLTGSDGKLLDFPPYVMPIRVEKEGVSATRDGKEFDLHGMKYGNMVTYITISPAQKGISVVAREWGLYSESAAWYSELDGFTAGADRTVAMDKDYVYVSLSSAAGGIYALSRTSGAFVKKLDVSPAQGRGNTFPVSCVRTIKNTAGNDILTFCSLKGDSGQHLYVYAYVNGTDAAPVQILDFAKDNKGGVEDWRRYGDRYTVTGTWQDGELWFQTWSDGGTAKTIGFTLKNGTVTNPEDPIDYYVAGPKAGIKDVVWYPGWDHVLITENGKGTFFKPGSAGPNGWLKWDQVEVMEDLSLTYGYNFFEFHDQNFIAYAQVEGENAVRGRLVIMDDDSATPADFPAQLKARSNVREFPIQHEEDFEAKSAVTAASSVADCTVWEISGNTYIAVLVQGCGLSVFQLQ